MSTDQTKQSCQPIKSRLYDCLSRNDTILVWSLGNGVWPWYGSSILKQRRHKAIAKSKATRGDTQQSKATQQARRRKISRDTTAHKTPTSRASSPWRAPCECFSRRTLGAAGHGVTDGAPATTIAVLQVLCWRSCQLIGEASRQLMEGWELGSGWCP